jgi:hypothetical protein
VFRPLADRARAEQTAVVLAEPGEVEVGLFGEFTERRQALALEDAADREDDHPRKIVALAVLLAELLVARHRLEVDPVGDRSDRSIDRVLFERRFGVLAGAQHEVGLRVEPAEIPAQRLCEDVRAAKTLGEVLAGDVSVEDQGDVLLTGAACDERAPGADHVAVGDVEPRQPLAVGDAVDRREFHVAAVPGRTQIGHVRVDRRQRGPLVVDRGTDTATVEPAFQFQIVQDAHTRLLATREIRPVGTGDRKRHV